jgi:predicted kinase
MRVSIMRGLPGSGKSTWAKQQKDGYIISADHWFMMNPGRQYIFKPEEIGKAHDECFRKFLMAMREDSRDVYTHVIIDNTNLSVWEFAPYYRLAQFHGHDVKIVQFECSPQTCARRQTHGVPEIVLGQMSERLRREEVPLNWLSSLEYVRTEFVVNDHPKGE